MRPGEIYVANFPFGDAPGMKLRPVLLLTGPVGPRPEVLVAYISSVIPPVMLTTDMLLDPSKPEFGPTHLKAISVLRLHKLATIHTNSLARRLGSLSPKVAPDVSRRLRMLLNL